MLVGVEGAEADEVDAPLAQGDEVGDDIDDMCCLEDAVFRCGVDQEGGGRG